MSKLVSIIIPCYNQAHYLKDSVQSVLDQTYQNWECIIVNDGSPDNTKRIAKKWCELDKRYIYIEQKNAGLSSARNAGIEKSQGHFILPLDADDILHPEYLIRTLPILLQDEDIAVASCYTSFFEVDTAKIFNGLQPSNGDIKSILYQNKLVASSLFRKSSWTHVGGYDENMRKGFEDWEFWIRLLKDGATFYVIPEVLFYYRKSKKSMLTETISIHFESVKEYIIKKHSDIYIADFENFVSVQFHNLRTSRSKERQISNSWEYKFGKLMAKPYHFIVNWFAHKNRNA